MRIAQKKQHEEEEKTDFAWRRAQKKQHEKEEKTAYEKNGNH